MKRFRRAHENYHQMLTTLEDQQSSVQYLRDEVRIYLDFKEQTERYIEIANVVSPPVLNPVDRAPSLDSSSQVGSIVYQRTSSVLVDHVQPSDSVSQVESRLSQEQSRTWRIEYRVSKSSQRSSLSVSVIGKRDR